MNETHTDPLTAARAKLGMRKNDRAQDYAPLWAEARQRLETLIAQTQDPAQKEKHLAELTDFNTAVHTVQNHPPKKPKKSGLIIWLLTTLTLLTAGYWGIKNYPIDLSNHTPTPQLDRQTTHQKIQTAISKRNWEDATTHLNTLQNAYPQDPLLTATRQLIASGLLEEKQQQIQFLTTNIQSSLDTGNLDDTERQINELTLIHPQNKKLKTFHQHLKNARRQAHIHTIITDTQLHLSENKWQQASATLTKLETLDPQHPQIIPLLADIENTRRQMAQRKIQAYQLYQQAKKLDQGTFSEEALTILQNALRLSEQKDIRALYDKISAYGRIIHVPKDLKTITAALQQAKPNDRILLAPGTYTESVIIPAGISLEGTAASKTIIQYPAAKGSAVLIQAGEASTRLYALSIRQTGHVYTDERFPALAIIGGHHQIEGCRISNGAGHGIAVLNGAKAEIRDSSIKNCGWDGIAVQGKGSYALIDDCTSQQNLHHGFDFWEGATGQITRSRSLKNGRAGIVLLDAAAQAQISHCLIAHNRQVGIHITNTKDLDINHTEINHNILGGVLLEKDSTATNFTSNTLQKNEKAGLIIERGSHLNIHQTNTIHQNQGKQIWNNATFPHLEDVGTAEIPTPPPSDNPPPPETQNTETKHQN